MTNEQILAAVAAALGSTTPTAAKPAVSADDARTAALLNKPAGQYTPGDLEHLQKATAAAFKRWQEGDE